MSEKEEQKKLEDSEYIGNIWGSKITMYAFVFLALVFVLYFVSGYLGCMSPNEVAE